MISKVITTTPAQLQNTYRVRLNPDGTPPDTWRAEYRIEFDNPAQTAITHSLSALDDLTGVLNYWYNQQEKGYGKFFKHFPKN